MCSLWYNAGEGTLYKEHQLKVQVHILDSNGLREVRFEDVRTITVEDDRSIMVTERDGVRTFLPGTIGGSPVGHRITLDRP